MKRLRSGLRVVALALGVVTALVACAPGETSQGLDARTSSTTTKPVAVPPSGASGPRPSDPRLRIPTTLYAGVSPPTTLISEKLQVAGATATVESTTCTIEINIETDTVGFAFDAAVLSPQGQDYIVDVRKALDGASVVRIVGHSSSEGDRGYNVDLSRRRANSVREALAQLMPGVAFDVDGKGPDDPVGDNNTEEGRSANRRVVIAADLPHEKCS